MPEGDTIHALARTLRPALAGRVVEALDSPLARLTRHGLVGRTLETVEAHGKNLLMGFDDGRTLYTHMKMKGRWALHRPDGRWARAGHILRVALHVPGRVAVCTKAPVVELLTAQERARHPILGALAPDLLAPAPDYEEMARRLRLEPHRAVGEALMDQRRVAGIGNVYKSELLFEARLNPFDPVDAVSEAALERLLKRATRWMRRNLMDGGPRRTRWGSAARGWVYDRAGQPCAICGDPVQMRRQGEHARSTYFCPPCQGVAP
jgi:endonuclease VIII